MENRVPTIDVSAHRDDIIGFQQLHGHDTKARVFLVDSSKGLPYPELLIGTTDEFESPEALRKGNVCYCYSGLLD